MGISEAFSFKAAKIPAQSFGFAQARHAAAKKITAMSPRWSKWRPMNSVLLGMAVAVCALIVVKPASGQQIVRFTDESVKSAMSAKTGPLARVGRLAALRQEYMTALAGRPLAEFKSADPLYRFDQHGRVLVEAVAREDSESLLADLKALGFEESATSGRVISGWLPIEVIDRVAALPSLQFARQSVARLLVGSVTSQGDPAMEGLTARASFGVDGSVVVGVLSDSYNCLKGAATDVASGDLPPGVKVLKKEKGCESGTDEGRALMQLISDVAPGAKFVFHSAFNGMADFAKGIVKLANTGARVIVDDVIYLTEPMFQDGIIAQAVNTVHNRGVAYFSAAGNEARDAYESSFRPGSGVPGPFGPEVHDFNPGPGVDVLQQITVPVGSATTLSFQWDQPSFSVSGPPGSASDIDICITSDPPNPPVTLLACGFNSNVGGDPLELVSFQNTGGVDEDGVPGPDTTFNIVIAPFSGPIPNLMKYVRFDGPDNITVNEFDTQSGSLFGHANAKGAEAVGAAFYGDTPAFGQTPPLLEPFSSAGPTPILFDEDGQPVSEVRNKPEIVAPDGTDNTFLGGTDFEPNGFPNLFGTSASAPHAAGVAALMLDANATIAPDDVYAGLENSTFDMNGAGFDFDTGFGLIQAPGAVSSVPAIDLDHYTMYKDKVTKKTDKFFKFGPIELTDRLETDVPYDVQKPQRLGLPADKNAEGVIDAVTHFQDYKIKLSKGAPKFVKRSNLAIANQCSSTLIQLVKPDSILVPTSKDLVAPVPPLPASALDHYLCYKAKIQKKDPQKNKVGKLPKGTQVEVEDQFQTRRYDLKKITRWCTPVAKDGSPLFLAGPDKGQPVPTFTPAVVSNPDLDLLCYKAKRATKQIEQSGCGSVNTKDKGTKITPKQDKHAKRTSIFINNQFGPLAMDSIREDELCIPSRTIVPE